MPGPGLVMADGEVVLGSVRRDGGLMTIASKRKPTTWRVCHCAGTVGGHCTPLSRGGRSVLYNPSCSWGL